MGGQIEENLSDENCLPLFEPPVGQSRRHLSDEIVSLFQPLARRSRRHLCDEIVCPCFSPSLADRGDNFLIKLSALFQPPAHPIRIVCPCLIHPLADRRDTFVMKLSAPVSAPHAR